MKLLIVNNLYYPFQVGGAERSVEQLVLGLRDRGHDCRVLSLGVGNSSNIDFRMSYPFMNRIWPVNDKRNFIHRLFFQFFGDYFSFHLKKQFMMVLQEYKPDVVHTNNLAGIGDWIWKECRNKNIKVVHTLRDYYQICAKQTMWSEEGGECSSQCRKCRILTSPRKQCSKSVDVVVGNSRYTLDRHLTCGYFESARAHVISGGLASDFGKNHISTDCIEIFDVGYIGQIIPSKGVEVFLEFVRSEGVSALVAGTGPLDYVNHLKEVYRDSKVTWLGRVAPEEFYSRVGLVVVPSLWPEPLPRVVYEAYAYGLPVIASAVGGNPDVLFPDHRMGLFLPDNLIDLVRAYREISSLVDSTTTNTLIEYSKMFSRENVVSNYLELYKEVLV